MNSWLARCPITVDFEILEESALAMAQSRIQNAITAAGLSRAELARRMECNRSVVSRILSGSHNLTIKTMARALAACGAEVRFETVPIQCNWTARTETPTKKVAAPAATKMPGIWNARTPGSLVGA